VQHHSPAHTAGNSHAVALQPLRCVRGLIVPKWQPLCRFERPTAASYAPRRGAPTPHTPPAAPLGSAAAGAEVRVDSVQSSFGT